MLTQLHRYFSLLGSGGDMLCVWQRTDDIWGYPYHQFHACVAVHYIADPQTNIGQLAGLGMGLGYVYSI